MEEDSRKNVLQKLKDRNQRCQLFASLIHTNNKLLEGTESYRQKNVQLIVEVERYKQENDELQKRLESGGGGSSGSKNIDKSLTTVNEKVFRLQEELNELHRKNAENSQTILNQTAQLQEKDREIQAKDAKILEMEMKLSENETNVQELITTNQMLTDEQQALQLAFTSLEEKFRKQAEENNDLVHRWMAYKARDADKLNEENDEFLAKRNIKMQQQLAEAAKEPVNIVEKGPAGPPICFSVSIPDNALCKFDAHEGEVNTVKWSPSGRCFATGGTDRKLKLWGVSNGKCVQQGILSGSNAAIMSVDFDFEETVLLAASSDFAVRVWTVSDHRLRHTLTGHSGKVLAAKFLGDPSRVASGSHDRTVRIWDIRSIACIKTMFAGSSCNDLVISDGLGTTIISGHFDRKIRFWDTRSEQSTKDIALNGRITSLDLSPDRNILLGCTRDDSIRLIDLRMNQVSGTLSADGFHVGSDWARAVFSPDGQYVMCGSGDGSLFIWDITKKKVEKVLKEHTQSIVACSWHPTGNMLLSCDRQRKVILWSDF